MGFHKAFSARAFAQTELVGGRNKNGPLPEMEKVQHGAAQRQICGFYWATEFTECVIREIHISALSYNESIGAEQEAADTVKLEYKTAAEFMFSIDRLDVHICYNRLLSLPPPATREYFAKAPLGTPPPPLNIFPCPALFGYWVCWRYIQSLLV